MSTCKEEAKMAFDFFFLKFQIKTLQQENSSLKKQCQKAKEQFQQQKVSLLLSFCIYIFFTFTFFLSTPRKDVTSHPFIVFPDNGGSVPSRRQLQRPVDQ